MNKRIISLILITILILILTGCDNRKCIKSHTKQSVCVMNIYNGKSVQSIVVPCQETICDEYEDLEGVEND